MDIIYSLLLLLLFFLKRDLYKISVFSGGEELASIYLYLWSNSFQVFL